MSATLPDDIKETISGCEDSLDALEGVLEPLLSTPWDVLTGKLDAQEKAKLNLMMAYAAESLYFIYLKTQGQSTEDHPVTEDLNRIKGYMSKLKQAAGSAEKEQQRLKLNKNAAQRFIKAGLGKSERSGKADEDEGNEEGVEENVSNSEKKKQKKSK